MSQEDQGGQDDRTRTWGLFPGAFSQGSKSDLGSRKGSKNTDSPRIKEDLNRK